MTEFAKTGQVIETLEFPRNEFQQYGNVVILYTTFRLVLKAPDGSLRETRGRGTEVFVKYPGTGWAHTAWHLDEITT
jgi:ketosteroid isomerase-like protein